MRLRNGDNTKYQVFLSTKPNQMNASITPVILTCNEEANLSRTLEGVAWARDIVLVDSFSNDQTLAVAARFDNVRIFQRRFDTHANQWNFAIEQTNIVSDWVLALDADYVAPPGMQAELARASADSGRTGFLADFRYCVFGRPLRASLYPAHVVLFRRGCGRYEQFGHTQRLVIDGEIGRLAVKLDHDDRKPLGRWLEAQAKYAGLEAEFVARGRGELRAIDRLRKTGWLAPIVVLLHVLLVKRCLLEGWRGWYYALQRALFEILFCLAWLERGLMRAPVEGPPGQSSAARADGMATSKPNRPPSLTLPHKGGGRRQAFVHACGSGRG
jgi:glycosyltransferase involved in cell wall biosynthesis